MRQLTSLIQANYGCEDRIYDHLLQTATIIFSHLAGLCKCFSLGKISHGASGAELEDPTRSGVSLDDTAGSQGDRLVLVAPVVGVVGVVGVATSVIWLMVMVTGYMTLGTNLECRLWNIGLFR